MNTPTQLLLGRPLIGNGANGAPGTGQAGGAGGLLYGNGGVVAPAGLASNSGRSGGAGGAGGNAAGLRSNSRLPTTLNARDQPPAEVSDQRVSGLTGAVQ